MHENLFFILALVLIVMLLVMLAERIHIAYPIFLVLAGLIISVIPGIPTLSLDPDIIFLIFLPPLLYEAAWNTSWNDFWKWKRPIALLSVGLVFFTSIIVAYFSKMFVPGFTLAMGFLLGGIISPPDAIAAATVLKGIKVPKRTLTILEGESLVNDASSLIVFRFALATILTGSFSLGEASLQFFWVGGMGILTGIAIAHVFYAIHRFLPTTPTIDGAITIMTPYILFLTAEHFDFSGVMAVVSGGLFISFRSHEIFKKGNTRISLGGFWTTVIFIMNTLVFVFIGLELPDIISGLGQTSIIQGIKYGIYISIVIIISRIIWVYLSAYIPRWLSKKIRKEELYPGWKSPLIVGWAGMRGVVSLATALSIPYLMKNGEIFVYRNLIILISFTVILITLVFQGLTLPFILKFIKIEEIDPIIPEYEQQIGIQIRLNKIALSTLNDRYSDQINDNKFLSDLKANLETELITHEKRLNSFDSCINRKNSLEEYKYVMSSIYEIQRKEIFKMKREKYFSDEELRKAESQLDLNELHILIEK